MITIAHVLVGGAIGVATGNPVAALVAGAVSHFAMDFVPHLDVDPRAERNEEGELPFTKQLYIQAFTDVIIAFAIVMYIWKAWFAFPELNPFVFGAFGGFLPDLIDNVPFWKKAFRRTAIGKPFHAFHEYMHALWDPHFPMIKYWWLGIITQVIAVVISLQVLKNFA